MTSSVTWEINVGETSTPYNSRELGGNISGGHPTGIQRQNLLFEAV
jgi:hypothetical protein